MLLARRSVFRILFVLSALSRGMAQEADNYPAPITTNDYGFEDSTSQVQTLDTVEPSEESDSEEIIPTSLSVMHRPGRHCQCHQCQAAAVKPAPKPPTVTINGFFQADTLWFNQDAKSLAAVGDLQDGAGFRRTRLSAKGAVAENVNYFIQMDFGFFGRPTFTDVWGEVTKLPVLGNVRVGQWKQPFGLESITSVRYQTFMERSLNFQTFIPFRHIGAGFYDWSEDENWTWAMSVFRSGNDQFGNDIGDNGGISTSGRMTHLFWFDKKGSELDYFHVGGAFFHGNPANNKLRYATIPEMFVGAFGAGVAGTSQVPVPTIANGTPPFVDTGTFPAVNFTNLGSEFLWVRGPFSIQSEAQVAMVNSTHNGTLFFPGVYAYGSYFLTGESRPYDRKSGALERVVPLNPFLADDGGCYGPGAWELAIRGSYINLNNGGIAGGKLFDMTAGVNWYLNGYTKLQFNYVKAYMDSAVNGHSVTDIVGMRAQVDF